MSISENSSALTSQPMETSNIQNYDDDPLFQAMQFFMELELAVGDCFKSQKTWLPLRFEMNEQSNDDVHFEISTDTIVNLKKLKDHNPSYESIPKNQKRLRCAFWEVAAKQNNQARFDVTRTIHYHEQQEIRLKGDPRNTRPGIGYGHVEISYTPTYRELTDEFHQTAFQLLTPQQSRKFSRYLEKQKMVKQNQTSEP